jgi:DNA-binding XRE family transcriptional regulator
MSATVREAVTPLPAKTAPLPATLPIDAIREAVRAECEPLRQGFERVCAEVVAQRQSIGAIHSGRYGASLAVFHAIASLLAVRLMLLLALMGGFALAWRALDIGTPQAGAVVVAYAVLLLLPLVWLERAPRPRPAPSE